MLFYTGGTLHEHHLTSYSFNYNFISDLGRNHTPAGVSNYPVNFLFRWSITITGISIFFFFTALPGIFKDEMAKSLAILATLAGIIAGFSYIGLAWVPYDESYRGHHMFVRTGFLSFLVMSLFFAVAILSEKPYPKIYAYVLLAFSMILFSQILLMFLGERSWRSNEALFRQATAQKIVVYSEIICMLLQTFGTLSYWRKRKQ
jgi:hypothetical membrane protein